MRSLTTQPAASTRPLVVTLGSNTTGTQNTATGSAALFDNATGNDNTAAGRTALGSNTTGSSNTASGVAALGSNTTGDFNAATGHFALFSNTTGSGNIALGDNAGTNLTTGDNNIDIGNVGVAGEANTIRIGTQGTQTSTFIAGITGTAITGRPLMINGSGQLGTAPSSARYKNEIKPMDAASEVILGLKPVTFRYKKEIDPDGIPQFGLVAEEVEKVNRDLVTRDPGGKAFTVRYEAVNAMLLNEFLKEHRKVTEQGATIAKQQDEIKALTAAVKEQGTQIQKVGAQLALDKSVRRIVDNNQ
jgi:hypothetical protein